MQIQSIPWLLLLCKIFNLEDELARVKWFVKCKNSPLRDEGAFITSYTSCLAYFLPHPAIPYSIWLLQQRCCSVRFLY